MSPRGVDDCQIRALPCEGRTPRQQPACSPHDHAGCMNMARKSITVKVGDKDGAMSGG